MKKLCGLFLTALILLYSCQKETSYENGAGLSAEGSLQSDVNGDCLPKDVLGTYEASTELVAADNRMEVQVDVLKTGPYLISTDTVNGYFFSAKGNFTATGLTTVTLEGKGTPLEDGIDNFRVLFDSTECIVAVAVLPLGGSGPAVMTFNGAPGACMDFAVAGNYVINVPLVEASNTVSIKVNVTTAGTYSITSQASNGMIFTGSGTVLTGEQTIVLRGSGTPVSTGPTNIPLDYNSTTNCGFTINVLAEPAKDYFPRTAGSNWSYEIDDDAMDTVIYRARPGTETYVGNEFNIFEVKNTLLPAFVPLSGYRKDASNYYIYTDLQYWLGFDASQPVEFLFLKDDAAVGNTWYSAEYSGTKGGTAVKVRMKFVITQKDVPVTVQTSTQTFNHQNVIIVEEHYEIETGGTWVEDDYFYKHHYARGIGLVLEEVYAISSPATAGYKEELRRFQIAP